MLRVETKRGIRGACRQPGSAGGAVWPETPDRATLLVTPKTRALIPGKTRETPGSVGFHGSRWQGAGGTADPTHSTDSFNGPSK